MVQPILAGIVGAVTGFASTFALVIAGLIAVGATPTQAASGLLILCLFQAATAMFFSWRYRMPLSFAWSTPGAALLVAAQATTGGFATAVGAFVVCGVLIAITGCWPALTRAMTRIPTPIASAMLAGILFPICLAPVTAAVELPLLALPVIVTWLVLYRLAPRWAVPGALITTIIVIAVTVGGDWMTDASVAPQLILVAPQFEPAVLVSLALPLYVVTMAGQNVPGFAVLGTFGYASPPAAAVLIGSGASTAVGALFGGHAINLAALSAALMAGPDAHPDKNKRWMAAFAGGASYIVLGLGAGLAAALVAASPPVLITAVAGLAMLGALISAVTVALEDPRHRLVAIVTFLTVASGVVIAGIGSAFWGLLVGGLVMGWLSIGRRGRSSKS